MLDFLGLEDFVLNKTSNAVYLTDTAHNIYSNSSGFFDLLLLQEQVGFDSFWDDTEKNDKVIMFHEKLSYSKLINSTTFAPISFLIEKEPIYTKNSEVTGIITSVSWYFLQNTESDVSAQEQKFIDFFQKYIEEIKNYYESIIAAMPGNVYWLNRDAVLLGGNTNLARMFGLESYKDLSGLSYEEMTCLANWTEGQGESFKADELKIMSSGIPQNNLEEPPVLINGNKKYYISNKVPLKNIAGDIIGVLGISIDITDRKKMEQELVEAKDRAEEANRAKTQFLANMSHDMLSPLSGILLAAQAINEHKELPQEIAEISTMILAAGSQLKKFFTSCLDLSKLEMEEWASSTSIFSITKLVQDIYALYLPKAIGAGLSLSIICDPNLPEAVDGHHDSLYRALLNLVGNALKFTIQGCVTIRAYCEHIDEHHATIIFDIIDTGMGIPEDKFQLIFEKLQRLTPAYSGNIEGSGIGLYIVDQFIKRMGGYINVESEVGKGSIFTVSVPMRIAYQEQPLSPH